MEILSLSPFLVPKCQLPTVQIQCTRVHSRWMDFFCGWMVDRSLFALHFICNSCRMQRWQANLNARTLTFENLKKGYLCGHKMQALSIIPQSRGISTQLSSEIREACITFPNSTRVVVHFRTNPFLNEICLIMVFRLRYTV